MGGGTWPANFGEEQDKKVGAEVCFVRRRLSRCTSECQRDEVATVTRVTATICAAGRFT